MILYMYTAPRQGQKAPRRQTFDVKRKPISLRPFVASFKQIFLNSDFIHLFLMFFHMYIDCGRGRQPFVDKILMSTGKPCHFDHLLQVSKQYLRSLILYMSFHVFIHYIAPGQGQTTPWGQNFFINTCINLLSLWSFAISFFH